MKHLTKLLATALLALGLNQAVWADDALDFRQTLQRNRDMPMPNIIWV